MSIKVLLQRAFVFPAVQRAVYRWGPAYWLLNSTLRRGIVCERAFSGLPEARATSYSGPEIFRLPPPGLGEHFPTLGHRLAARTHKLRPRRIVRLDRAWIVGQHGSVVTPSGKLLLSSFANKPSLLGLEQHDDLIAFLKDRLYARLATPVVDTVVPLVNRLDPNYFHWIIEICGGLEGVLRDPAMLAKARFLIRKGSPSFRRESLRLLGVPDIQIDEHADDAPPFLATNVIVPSIPGAIDACSPQSLQWVREAFFKGAGVHPSAPLQGAVRIYIHRQKSGWRSLANSDEVAEALQRAGFLIYQPEKDSLTDQVRMFSRASMIVGLHGAGLTNAVFAPNARLLEMIGSYGDGHMYSIAAGLGMLYASLRCEPRGDDAVANISSLLAAIEQLDRLPIAQAST